MTTVFSWKMAMQRQVKLIKKSEIRCKKHGNMPEAIREHHRCEKLEKRIKELGL